MPFVIALGVLVVLAAVALVVRSRRSSRAAPPAAPPAPEVKPMNDLESALDQAMDRSGRNMRERLAETTAIDDLRIPDDTGPLLRRALDSVEHHAPPTGAVGDAPAT